MTTTEMLRGRLENKPGVIGATCITRTGRYFDFVDPQPDQIHHDDIAWGLAHANRFGGQVKPGVRAYNVAHHSWLASDIVAPEIAFQALMHDAAEAYTGDMIGPLKQLCPDFKAVEKRVEAAIFAKYGLPPVLSPEVKHADLVLLRTEQRDLTSGAGDSWNGLDQWIPLGERIMPWGPRLAAHRWLERFHKLTDGRFR